MFPDALYIDLHSERIFQDYLVNVEPFTALLDALPDGARVIIDEIQRLPNLLNEVHRYIEKKKLKFALSGSSARKLRSAGTNLLAGRALRREMFPLTPEELQDDFDLERVLTIGSIPLVWDAEDSRAVLDAYVQTYLREEIQAEALVRNLPGFARFLTIAALFHGQVLNASSLSRDAGVSRSSILNYLDILEDTLLAYRLQPFEGKLRVKEKRHPKLYWIDPGVARAARRRTGSLVEEERGSLFEGWVASTLKAYGSYRKLFDEWNYWAPTESDDLEVDFLLWKNDQCLAIEAKASSRWRPEYAKGLNALKNSWKDPRRLKRLVIYLGKDRMIFHDDIELLPVAHFIARLADGALF
jgi:predicted AAA+ superfamily ATPase